jgi:hypothetical protein
MIKIICLSYTVLIFIIGCTHTIKQNIEINEYYNRIEKLSDKKEAKIFLINEKSISDPFKYSGKKIRFYQDSIKFICSQDMLNIVLPIFKIDRILFSSGADGGIEGMLPGILFGTITGLTTYVLVYNSNHRNKYVYDEYNPGGYIPYIAVSLPLGMLLGYTVGSDIGKYVFIINGNKQ